MAPRALTRIQSNKLLSTLLDNAELPAFVRRLKAPTLNRLIDHVGLEDAGPLISLTTDQQLREVLDASLWSTLTPGKPQTHSPEAFVRWLDVLIEEGDSFVAERLFGLGADFVVLNFSRLISVDAKAAILHSAANAYAEEYGGYLVSALFDDEWDTTRAALTALQADYPEFCEHVLARCHGDVEWGKLSHTMLAADIYGERRDASEREGFVTPESAAAFLGAAKRASLSDLVAAGNHDLLSERYFSRLQTTSGIDEAGSASEVDAARRDPVKLRELEAILIEAEIVDDGATMRLLSAPEQHSRPVKRSLDALQTTDPAAFGERMSELVFLSNVLMTGTTVAGERFAEADAADAVLATCNLAFDYLGLDDAALGDGLVRLFRVGWRILQQLPLRAAQALVDALCAADLAEQMPDRAWILAEVEVSLAGLTGDVRAARFDAVKETLSFAALILEREVCDVLTAIISDVPRHALNQRLRYIESMQDLTETDAFLDRLTDGVKAGIKSSG